MLLKVEFKLRIGFSLDSIIFWELQSNENIKNDWDLLQRFDEAPLYKSGMNCFQQGIRTEGKDIMVEFSPTSCKLQKILSLSFVNE